MIAFSQLKQIHLEITNNCQASCPMCTRNVHGGLKNPNINKRGWTLDEYKKIISPEVIEQIENVYFCGNYGDPLLNDQLLEMVEYTTTIKKHININIHTNGSLRNKEWWTDLAKVMPNSHRVIFAIDGLEDTHSIYRVGTSYKKIIENARAFIDAGGIAEWAYIRFKHNEHQVDEARQLAIKLGFQFFTMKDSSRWLLEPKFKVLDKQGNTEYYLESSQYSTIKILDKTHITNYKNVLEQTEVSCYAKHVKEVYIDSYGHLFPCCWLAMIPYQPKDLETELHEVRNEIYKEYFDLVKSFGGIDNLDTKKNTIKDIINSNNYQQLWDTYWNEKKLITCGRTCGVQPELFSTPNDQFVSKETL